MTQNLATDGLCFDWRIEINSEPAEGTSELPQHHLMSTVPSSGVHYTVLYIC